MAANKKDPEKSVDVPPYGSRNPDPVTDSPGSHPIETGVGAAIGGAASGMAVGMVGGPVGAVVGAIVGGAAAGGLAGKGVGELIDPTTEDNWIREYFGSDKNNKGGDVEATRPAYRYGLQNRHTFSGKRFEDVESDLRSGWEKDHAHTGVSWAQARGAVKHAFDKTIVLHEEHLRANKHQVQAGEVSLRKEVVTERQQISVPVEREEVVIERRPVAGHAASGDIKAEEIRIPVKEEKVTASKETVVTEEVSVGKRKVQGTETVSGDVRREELKVEQSGDVNVRRNDKTS